MNSTTQENTAANLNPSCRYKERVAEAGGVVLPLNAAGSRAVVYGCEAISWAGDNETRGQDIYDSLVEQDGQPPRWSDNPAAPQWLVEVTPELQLGFNGDLPYFACWGIADGPFDWPALLDDRPQDTCALFNVSDTTSAQERWQALRLAFALLRGEDQSTFLDVYLWCVSHQGTPLIGVEPLFLEATAAVAPATAQAVTALLTEVGCSVSRKPGGYLCSDDGPWRWALA